MTPLPTVTCSAVTQTGVRCRKRTATGPYCSWHQPEPPADPARAAAATPPQRPLVVQPNCGHVRALRRALIADAQSEVQLALKVGVLVTLGVSRAEIARQLGVADRDLRVTFERLKRVAPLLDRDSDL